MPFLTPTERIGQLIDGRYVVDSLLAEGGMGTLFKGTDSVTGDQVAIKVLREQSAHDARSIARFQQEADTIRRLGHPHIVRVFDTGKTDDGVHFVVMELLHGRSLAQELEARQRLGVEEALSLLLPLMGALAVAHDNGIIHRDLTPSNIVLHEDEEGNVSPKLIDFGIAKVVGNTQRTRTGTVVGTPEYMSPEQAEGAEANPAFDVWAMGVVLFKCIAGSLPFSAPTPVGVLVKVVNEMAPSLVDVTQDIGKRFCVAVDRALNPNLRSRYSDMRSFASALLAAAKADNIALPQDPDPEGLPEWGKWLSGDLPQQHTISGLLPSERRRRPERQRRRTDGDEASSIDDDSSTAEALASVRSKSRARTRLLVAVAGFGVLLMVVAAFSWGRSQRAAPAKTDVSPPGREPATAEQTGGAPEKHSGTPRLSSVAPVDTGDESEEVPREHPSQPIAEKSPDDVSPRKERNKPLRADNRASKRRSPISHTSTALQRAKAPVQETTPTTRGESDAVETTAKGRGNTEIFVNYDE